MLLCTQTEVLAAAYGEEQAIRMLKEAGFDAFDLSLFRMNAEKDYAMNRPDFRDYAKKLRETASACGIVCSQAHAPFPSSTENPGQDEEIFECIVRSMEAASLVGAEIIVVHPKQHLSYNTCKEELKKLNLGFYRRLIPYCEKFGIRVACENMWQYNKEAGRIIESTCASPEEFCEYLDELDSPWIVGCLDVGHVVLTDQDLGHVIRTLGKSRLKALHVHDNDLHSDSHTMPFVEKIDFSALCGALKESGYEGNFTFECDEFLKKLPKCAYPEGLRLMEKVGRYLISQITQ